MPIPIPKYPLDNVCTTIYNNTLYSYSNDAFQSLKLDRGAEWEVLSPGVAVAGGVCVKTTPVNNTEESALWIVGGQSSDSGYKGLQRYSFSNSTWETIQATDPVAQNRQWHGAAYLNTSDSILMFAGSQDGTKQPSTHTFTIKASWPYNVIAYEANVQPAISPMVIPLTQSKALYVGGSETNTEIMIFSPSLSWHNSNATLATPFYNATNVKATIQNGNDASKTLLTFDMTVFPNSVNRTIFVDGDGNPVANATPIVEVRPGDIPPPHKGRSLDSRAILTVKDWPPYNNSLAPSSTRTEYSVARDQSGLTVISGGNHQDVLCIYKARDNCWANATDRFTARLASESFQPSASPSPSPTTILTEDSPVPTTTAAPAGGSSTANPNLGKILGGVFGALVGLALILTALLFLLRCRRRRKEFVDAGHQRRSSGIPDEKMDFADRGLPRMNSARHFRGHEQQASGGSMSSMAILLGRVGHKRGGDKWNGSQGSETSSQFNKEYKAAIGKPTPINGEQAFRTLADPIGDEKPIIQEARSSIRRTRGSSRGARRGSTRRSSGWNRYWSGGSSLNIFGFGKRESNRTSGSQYSDERVQSQVTQMSAFVPPLTLGSRPEMHRVVSGSPTIRGGGNFPLQQEMKGRIERPGSVSTLSSYDGDRRDAFSSGIPASVQDDHQQFWTPIGNDSGPPRASNAYTESNYDATTVGRETMFPRPSQPQPQQSTTQPRQPNTDMSWLNLGDQRGL